MKMGAPTTIVTNNLNIDPISGKAIADTTVQQTWFDAQTGQYKTQTSG
jgi:hypothetical protein